MLDLLNYCKSSVIRRGADLLERGAVSETERQTNPDGSVTLLGRAVDLFNFVDRVSITVSADADELVDYACTCPAARSNGAFCEHCAALVQNAQDLIALAAGSEEDEDEEISKQERDLALLEFWRYRFAFRSDFYPYPHGALKETSLELYEGVFGQTALARYLYETQDWQGYSYGMCALLAMLTDEDCPVEVQDFSEDATIPAELSFLSTHKTWKMTLPDVVHTLQLLQLRAAAQHHVCIGLHPALSWNLKELVDRVSNHESVIIELAGPSGAYTLFPYTCDYPGRNRINVCVVDPARPEEPGILRLTHDDRYEFRDWEYAVKDRKQTVTYAGSKGCSFAFRMVRDIWEEWNKGDQPGFGHALLTAPRGTVLLEDSGARMVINGKDVMCPNKRIERLFVMDRNKASEQDALWFRLEGGSYTLRCVDPDMAGIKFGFATQGQFFTAESTRSREIRFTVDDALQTNMVRFTGPVGMYSIRLFSLLEHTHEDVRLEGTAGHDGEIAFAQIRGELYGIGLGEDTQQTLLAEGAEISVDTLKTTLPDSALLAEALAEAPAEPVAQEPIYTRGLPVGRYARIHYAFNNSRAMLYPGIEDPKIPLERYELMYGKNQRSRMFFDTQGSWGGNCYGMSSTLTMLTSDDCPYLVSDFENEAELPSALTIGSFHRDWRVSLLGFIEAMQIGQSCRDLQLALSETLAMPVNEKFRKIIELVKNNNETNTQPIIMGIFRPGGGHEIYPYDYYDLSDRQGVLLISDPNYSWEPRYMFLTKDENGEVIDWRYQGQDDPVRVYCGSENGRCGFSMLNDYQKAWEMRGVLSKEHAVFGGERGTALYDAADSCVVRLGRDTVEILRDDVVQIMTTDGAQEDQQLRFWLNAGTYTIRREDPELETLSFRFAHVDQYAVVQTDASEVSFTVQDELETNLIEIAEQQKHYSIRLYSSIEGDYPDAALEGVTGSEGLTFGQIEGELYGVGLGDDTTVKLLLEQRVVSRSILNDTLPDPEEQEERLMEKHQTILITNDDEDEPRRD